MKFKKYINESLEASRIAAVSRYRSLANLDENMEVTADTINEWALNEAAVSCGVQKADLRHLVLGEDISIDAAARQMEAEKEIVRTKSEIEEVLDDTLRTAKRKHRAGSHSNYPTILIEGEAGIGKTAIVASWCSENGLSFYNMDIRNMSPEAFEGVVATDARSPEFVTRKISREFLLPLSRPNSVLMLDEFNRAGYAMRGKLMDLILNHRMAVPFVSEDINECKEFYSKYGDFQDDGMLYFPNLLFVVCAQNPSGSERYNGTMELDSADIDRMKVIHPEVNYESLLQYFTRKFNNELAQFDPKEDGDDIRAIKGQLAIATELLRSPDFSFDTSDERDHIYQKYGNSAKYLTPRSLEFCLVDSDGTKDGFLRQWDHYCNRDKKEMIENILSHYKDVEDEATAAVASESDSPLFKTKPRLSTTLRQNLSK